MSILTRFVPAVFGKYLAAVLPVSCSLSHMVIGVKYGGFGVVVNSLFHIFSTKYVIVERAASFSFESSCQQKLKTNKTVLFQ